MNRKIIVCILYLSLCYPLPVLATWPDELVDDLKTEVGALDNTLDTGDTSPYSLLPLSEGNEWMFLFENNSPGEQSTPSSEMSMSLGETERLGDFCLSPLVFGKNKQLELFINNSNDRLVFYGFRGQISGEDIGFFFRNGKESSIDSGIDLASVDEGQDLLLEQSGTQPAEINGQAIQLTWIARQKSIQEPANSKSFDGKVAGEDRTISPSQSYVFEFDLFFKPCEVESGCFAGRFRLEFMPKLGLTGIRLLGDSPSLGGQYDYKYELLDTTSSADTFFLGSQGNQLSFFSCNALFSQDKLSRAATGSMLFWFTIALLIAVVLRESLGRYNGREAS